MTEPESLDHEHAARIRALFDAFAAAIDDGGNSLFLHESSIPHLAYVAATWARGRGLEIDVKVNNTDRLYESWSIAVGDGGKIHIFPKSMFMLGEPEPDVVEKINAIRKEAEDRIRELTIERPHREQQELNQ